MGLLASEKRLEVARYTWLSQLPKLMNNGIGCIPR
jgi:hypothetical protein